MVKVAPVAHCDTALARVPQELGGMGAAQRAVGERARATGVPTMTEFVVGLGRDLARRSASSAFARSFGLSLFLLCTLGCAAKRGSSTHNASSQGSSGSVAAAGSGGARAGGASGSGAAA